MILIDDPGQAPLAQVRALLDAGVPVNGHFDDGGNNTPLTQAAGFGQLAVVNLLLQRGANVNARDYYGKTALWNAASTPMSEAGDMTPHGPVPPTPAQRAASTANYTGIIGALLKRGANPDTSEPGSGMRPVAIAAYRGHLSEARALLEGGADPNARDRFGKTPLEWATYNGFPRVAELLRAHGARVGVGHPLPKPNQRALDIELREALDSLHPSLAKARALLERGADSNGVVGSYEKGKAPDLRSVTTPLAQATDATGRESREVTRLLLQRGADPNIADEVGRTPLMSASVETARLLLARGARVNAQDVYGGTALMTSTDNLAKTRLLLAHGADVNARNNEGQTALFRCDNQAILELLLKRGADINAADESGETALMEAAQQNYGEGGVTNDAEWARVLLRHGANPNARSSAGRTALMILAAPYGQPTSDAEYFGSRLPFARMLIGRGTRLDTRDNRGLTAKQIARSSGALELARLLRAVKS